MIFQTEYNFSNNFACEETVPHTQSCGNNLEEMTDDEFSLPILHNVDILL